MLDLVLRKANLPDGRTGIDIALAGDRIVAVGPGLAVEARQSIDATGRLATPPFVDSHFHMDSTLSLGQPRLNRSGTLLEGMALWGERGYGTRKPRGLQHLVYPCGHGCRGGLALCRQGCQ